MTVAPPTKTRRNIRIRATGVEQALNLGGKARVQTWMFVKQPGGISVVPEGPCPIPLSSVR
jgi:hypothetical protein